MKSSLARKTAAAFAVALVSIAGLSLWQYRTLRRLATESQLVAHSYLVLQELVSARNSLNRADASAQSFRITGDSSYIASYAQVTATLSEHLRNLHKLTADNPTQQGNLDMLEPLAAASLRALQEEIDSRKAGNPTEAESLALEAAVRKSIDDFRTVAASMETDELELQQQRAATAQQANRQANSFVLLGSALACVFLGAFAIALFLDIAARNRSEAHFRQLLESAPDAVVIVNRDGRIVLTNRQTEKVFGYEPEEMLGQPVEMLMPQPHREKHRGHRAGYSQAPQPRAMGANLELRGLRKDGTEFPVEISLSPMETERETLVTSAIRDITERRAAEEVVKAQAQLLNAANDAIWAGDSGERITYWNQGAERLYGWTQEEAIGKSVHELLQTEFPVPFEEIAKEREQGDWQGELVHTKRDGTKITVSSRWTGLQSAQGEFTGWLQISTDITERKRAEENLRALSGRLLQMQEDERRHIGRELHDSLGQYLSVLKMELDILQSDAGPAGDGKSEKLAECARLAEQSLAEVRTASYLLYPPMLDELGLQPAVRIYLEGFGKRSGIQTTFEIPANLGRMERDVELALFRVLQESLTNVYRHSGSPTARIRVLAEDGAIGFEVTDAGKGIPAERLDEFQKGLPGKLGVGLRGMEERLRQFGGKLEISSNKRGTTVRVTIPSGKPGSASVTSA